MTDYTFEQLVDISQVRQLLQTHHRLSKIAYGILDPEGNILVAIGWQEVCEQFHRKHSVSNARCRESNAYIHDNILGCDGDYLESQCKNGLIDAALPIIIAGKHLATFYAGQFMYDDDKHGTSYFRLQAEELGFDAEEYLASLEQVPVFSRGYVRDNMMFLRGMVNIIAESGYNNLRLAREMEERKAAETMLESERALLQTLIQTLPDPVWLKDTNGVFLACNGAFSLLYGDTPSNIIGRRDNDYVGDDLAAFFQQKDREAMNSGQSRTNEEWVPFADGHRELWETRKTPLYDRDGGVIGVLGVARDITDHKNMEDELRAREQYQRALLDNFPFMVWLKDTESRLLAINRPYQEIAGLAPDAPYFGKTDLDLFPAELAEGYRADDREVMASGQKKTVEELIGDNDVQRWHETYKAPVFDADGILLGTVGFARDITERKQMEESVLKLNATLSATLQAVPALLFEVDEAGTYLAIWSQLKELLVLDESTLLGRTANEVLPPDVAAVCMTAIGEAAERGSSYGHVYKLDIAGQEHWFELSVTLKSDDVIGRKHFIVLALDITERKRMEDELLDRNLFLDSLLNAIPIPIFFKGTDVRYAGFNKAYEEFYGKTREELIGKGVFDLFPPEQAQVYFNADAELFRTGGSQVYETPFRDAKGVDHTVVYHKAVYCDKTGTVSGQIGAILDITERKRMEDALRFVAQRGWQDNAESFFEALARYLGERLCMDYALVVRIGDDPDRAETVAVYAKGAIVQNMRYALKGTPCGNVMGRQPCAYPHGVQQLFPEDTLLVEMGVESYAGIPLWDSAGKPAGLIAVMDGKPLLDDAPISQLLQLVATRASSELEREQNVHALRMREQEFRTLAENSPDNIVRYDRHGCRTYANAMALKLFGVDDVTILQNTSPEKVHFEGQKRMHEFSEKLKQVLKTGEPDEVEISVVYPSGDEQTHNVRFVAERDAEGTIIGVLSIGRDITERKRMEEALTAKEQEFRTLAENSPDNIARFDSNCRQIYMNPAMERTFGLDPAWLLGKTPIEQAAGDPELGAAYERCIRRVLETGEPGELEMFMPNPAGCLDTHLIRIVAERDTEGNIIGALAIGRDITERKRLEEALQKSSHMLEEAQRIARMGSWELDLTTNTIRWSDEIFQVFAINPHQLDSSYEAFLNVVHPDDREMVDRIYTESIEKHMPCDIEHRLLLPDDRIIHVHERCETSYDDAGTPLRTVGTIQDITERKQAEEALHESEMRLQLHVQHTPLGVIEWDTDFRVVNWNPAAERLFGYTAAEAMGRHAEFIVPLSDRPHVDRVMNDLLRCSGGERSTNINVTKDGRELVGEWYNTPLVTADGQVIGIASLMHDITERSRLEEALAAREREFRAIVENSPDAISRYDRECRRIYINPTMEDLLGRSASEDAGTKPTGLSPLPETAVLEQKIRDVFETGREFSLETPYKTAAGEVKWGHLRVVPELAPDGSIASVLSIGRDISDLKEAEQELRASEKRFRDIFDNSQDALYLLEVTEEGRFRNLEVNPAFERSTGLTRAELIGKYVDETVAPETGALVVEKYRRCVEGRKVLEGEIELALPAGQRFYYSSLVPVPDETGRIHRIVGITRDITERKQLEQALSDSEQQFRSLAENSPDNIIRYDRECRALYGNHQVQQIMNDAEAWFLHKTPLECYPDGMYEGGISEVENYQAAMQRVLSDGVTREVEMNVPHPDGTLHCTSCVFTPELDAAGNITGVLAFGRDINERKLMESALLESEQQFRTLTENSPNIIIRYDLECRRIYVNPAFVRELGIPADVALSNTLDDVWREEINMPMEDYRNRLRQVMDTGVSSELILEWPRPDTGQNSIHIFNLVPEKDHDGVTIGCLAIGHNITERRKAERALRNKREQLALVARELSVAEERERLRIATVLHDHIGQILLLSKMKLGALAAISKPAPIGSVIDEVRDLLEQATNDAHSLTVQLNPPMLSVSGLEAALQWLGRKIESDYNLAVEFFDDQQPKPLSEELRSILYQCARELLINAAKHAKTDKAWVNVGREEEMYCLTVEDHGAGFDLASVVPDVYRDCRLGLFSIQVRIERLGGSMEIESSPGNGTRITMKLPVKE